MAKFTEIIDKEGWTRFVASMTPVVQKLCSELPPDRLYLLKTSGHKVTIKSYCEDGTVTVLVSGKFNLLTFDRQVFGIKPEDLMECDLPGYDEAVGTVLTDLTCVAKFINFIRDTKALVMATQDIKK